MCLTLFLIFQYWHDYLRPLALFKPVEDYRKDTLFYKRTLGEAGYFERTLCFYIYMFRINRVWEHDRSACLSFNLIWATLLTFSLSIFLARALTWNCWVFRAVIFFNILVYGDIPSLESWGHWWQKNSFLRHLTQQIFEPSIFTEC